jgi:hypothetical protein
MKLSELKMLYEVFETKEKVKIAISSIEDCNLSIDDIENDNYFTARNAMWSNDNYALLRNGDVCDIEDSIYCEGEEEWFHIEDCVIVQTRHGSEWYSGSYVRNSSGFIKFSGEWYDEDQAERMDIVFVEDLDEYGYRDDNYYHEDDGNYYSYPEESYVRGYHNGSYEKLDFDGKSKYKIGFEIEKEDVNVRNGIDIDDFESATDELWRKEKDGSLDDESGYELISPTFEFNIDKVFEHIESNDTLVEHINAKYSTSCGGHIHLSEDGLTGEQLFDKVKGYTPLFYALYYGRVDRNYAKGKSNEDLKNDNEKYQAIKIHSNRVEFRIISAVPNVKTLKWRSKLLMMILQNPTDDVIRAYYNVDTKFTKLLKQTYSDDKLVELKERFIRFTNKFEGIEIKK